MTIQREQPRSLPRPPIPSGTPVTNPIEWQNYQRQLASWSRQQIAQQQAQQAIQPRVPYAPAAPTPQQIQQIQTATYSDRPVQGVSRPGQPKRPVRIIEPAPTPSATFNPEQVPKGVNMSLGAWNKLSSGTKESIKKGKLIPAVDFMTFMRMDSVDQEKVVNVTPTKVSSEAYGKLGPAIKGRTAQENKTAVQKINEMAEGMIPVYGTVRYWGDMSTLTKILSVIGDLSFVVPAVGATVKATSIKSVIVPTTAKGDITVWKGIAPNGKPMIGITQGKLSLGSKGANYPKLTEITAGYEPVTKVETSIMATNKALKTMGVSDDEIKKLAVTLKERKWFAGKESPYLTKTAPLPTVERLNQDEVATIFKSTKDYGNKIDKVFGTVSLEPQLAPKFRLWRGKHDIDIQTAMSELDTNKFTQDVLKRLKSFGKADDYRIAPDAPNAIEKNIGGEWKKIADIHSKETIPTAAEVSPTAREGAYGMMHTEKPVTINYPGIGKLNIMTASEMGKRKAQSILRWQEGKFAPYDYRVKDIVDFYVIDYTFRGEKAANAWAKAYGFDPGDLLKIAEKNPPKIVGWEFVPQTGKGLKGISGTSPSIILKPNQTMKSFAAALQKSSWYSAGAKPATAGVSATTATGSITRKGGTGKTYPVRDSGGAKVQPSPSIIEPGKVSPPVIPPSTSGKGGGETSITVTPVPDKGSGGSGGTASGGGGPSGGSGGGGSGGGSSGGSGGGSSGGGGTSGGGDSSSGGGGGGGSGGGKKQILIFPSTKLQVESVEGVPRDPAIVSWNDGIVRISVKPPYRQGTKDIEYKRLKQAEKGKGSQEDTLKITEGDAPEKLTLRQGFNRISISAGKHMSHYRLKSPHIHLQRRGTLIGGGKSRRQHRGMLIR